MIVYQENRKIIILKNSFSFLILSVILLLILDTYFPINKSKNELIILIIFSIVCVIISTKKIKLEFDNQNKILTIVDSHILGGGKQRSIPYEKLQFHINPTNILSVILGQPELTILNNGSKITEIKNLKNVSKSNELIALLENIIRENLAAYNIVLAKCGVKF